MKNLFTISIALICASVSIAQNNNIFSGGTSDGFSASSYAEIQQIQNNGIFSGSSRDGFAIAGFIELPITINNGIFSGGRADGFALAILGSNPNEVPLPLVLIAFEGYPEAKKNVLIWTTAMETSTDHFEVEWKAEEGFQKAGSVSASGDTHLRVQYRWEHEAPPAGRAYYRLKMFDVSGRFTYSAVIAVTRSMVEDQLSVFPNPTSPRGFNVRLPAHVSFFQLLVLNELGKTVYSNEFYLRGEEMQDQQINAQLMPGVYVVQITSLAFTRSIRLIVQSD